MRILVVEDEQKIAFALKKGLEQEGYAIDVLHDAGSGYRFASTEPYDLLILDRMLPGGDGIDLCKKLRSEGNSVPILLLTAKDAIQDRVEGLAAGADDYLVKPFAFSELIARVQALFRRPREMVQTNLVFGELHFEPATGEIGLKNKRLHLSKKEAALLEYLMRNNGKVISKDMLIAHVWDFDADVLPNTVEAYVRYLRTKLAKLTSQELIHTIRGFGYQFGEEQ